MSSGSMCVTELCSYPCSRFTLWAVLFVLGRLLTLSLSVLTVGFGLATSEQQGFDMAAGNFNVLLVRCVCVFVSMNMHV